MKPEPNVMRAADIISETISTDDGTIQGSITEAAQVLKDSGLLMPDLPEPDGFCDWDMDPLAVRIAKAAGKIYLAYLDPYEGQQISMFPDQAREVALAILAAATYAERNQA